MRAEHQTAYELGEQLLHLAQSVEDRVSLLQAHLAVGFPLFWLGDLASAQAHLEQGVALYDPLQHGSLASLYGQDSAVVGLSYEAWTLWQLGYPNQAQERSQGTLPIAQKLSHPFSLAMALSHTALFQQLRREGHIVQERAETVITLSTEQGFPHWMAQGTILRGWALAEQGQEEEGLRQLHQGLTAWRATGTEVARPWFLSMLAEAYGKAGQVEEGLTVLAEALATADKTGERFYEAEVWRIKGTLTLQSQVTSRKSQVEEAEACFLKAIAIAQKQQSKSLELRAVMSLARLWQQQDRKEEARQMLEEIYGWFTDY
jgi:predicted ATPase